MSLSNVIKYSSIFGFMSMDKAEKAEEGYKELEEYEQGKIDAQKKLEEEQLSREQTTARKIHAKRMGTLRSQLAQTGSILDVGTSDMLQEEETEAQAQQESVAMGDWFDRQQTIGEAKEMVGYKADMGAYMAEQEAIANYINTLASAGAMAGTGGAAGGGGVASGIGYVLTPPTITDIAVPIGQRRAGYKQWLAGGL